jgi:hypothetical protein
MRVDLPLTAFKEQYTVFWYKILGRAQGKHDLIFAFKRAFNGCLEIIDTFTVVTAPYDYLVGITDLGSDFHRCAPFFGS